MSIEINNESGLEVDESVLLRLVAYELDFLHVHPDAELAILLVDEAAMEQLHVQWMDEPGPTDVLSFPMDELRPGSEDDVTPAGLLGDIVLCRVRGAEYLHLIKAIQDTEDRFQIGNNRGGINGWTGARNIFGLCIRVDP